MRQTNLLAGSLERSEKVAGIWDRRTRNGGVRRRNAAAGKHARKMSSNWIVKSKDRQLEETRGPKDRSAPGPQLIVRSDKTTMGESGSVTAP